MSALDYINHRGHADHDPRKDAAWEWLSTVRDTGGRQPVVELQRRFSAATVELERAWATHRRDLLNRETERRYQRALRRCQMLKTAIFETMTRRRLERMAA